jgi:hypothetical protein
LQRCNSFYSCEKFTIACRDKYTDFNTNTSPPFNGANEETQHLLHVEKFSVVSLLLPVLMLFIGVTSAAEVVGYNIERGGNEREW